MASEPSSGSPSTPVFVFPHKLNFYSDDPTTHKIVMTIYNPYEVTVSFKVLCNNPKKYAVVEPEGKISGQKCVDILVRHIAISPQAVNQTDKFRIHLADDGNKDILGKKDVLATLHQGLPDPNDEKQSHSLPHSSRQSSSLGGQILTSDVIPYDPNRDAHPPNQPNTIACLAALVCIISLFLPTEGDDIDNTVFKEYPWLCLTVNLKLVFAYVLGLVTTAILRTT